MLITPLLKIKEWFISVLFDYITVKLDEIVNNSKNSNNDIVNNNDEGSNRFAKILVAFDGSEPSMDAVNYAMKIGNKYNSHLIVLHVIDNYKFPYLLSTVVLAPTYGSEKSVEERKKFEGLMNSLKEKYLRSSENANADRDDGLDNTTAKIELTKDGAGNTESSVTNDTFSSVSKTKSFESDIVEAETSAAATIVDYAESKNVDMIVVGSRGRTGLKKMLVGSVASDVLKYAHCPVMVVR